MDIITGVGCGCCCFGVGCCCYYWVLVGFIGYRLVVVGCCCWGFGRGLVYWLGCVKLLYELKYWVGCGGLVFGSTVLGCTELFFGVLLQFCSAVL